MFCYNGLAVPRRIRIAVLALFHLAALALTARLAHWPFFAVLLAVALAVLPINIYSRFVSGAPCLPVWSLKFEILNLGLAPLYLVAALRLLVALAARALCSTCYTYLAVPEPFASVLSFEWAFIFGLAALAALQARRTFSPQHHARLAAFALAALALLWIAILYPRLIPAGVTGADPFAYVQMGVDLAARGTPMHHFPLADVARDLNIPIYPTLFVGYTIPHNGDSATVWPPGFSALLAVAFRFFGERGLYILNPILGLLCAAATYALARRVFGLPPFFSLFAAALLVTSFEQTIRLSIPLADLAAQLSTTLAIIAALTPPFPERVSGEGTGGWGQRAVTAGIFSALAFATRYTQLLLVPGILFVLVTRSHNTPHTPHNTPHASRAIFHFSFFIISFLAVSLPDTLYRAAAFGSPFSFASGELSKFSAADVLPVALRFLAELAADFNVAVPLILLGVIHLARNHRSIAAGLALLLGPVVLFHLPYHYLKLRDLLFLFPALCALAALGLQRFALHVSRFTSYASRFSFFILHSSLFILLAFRFNAQLPFLDNFYTYGFLNAGQRAHVESIAGLTPPNAVIAASLNSGALSLYAGRDTIRPGRLLQPGRTWTEDEFIRFVETLRADGRPLYLLMDGEEMAGPADSLRRCCRLAPIAELYLPYYYRNGAASNEIVTLYRIDFIK